MADLLINGIDTEALGFRVARPAGQDDGVARDWSELQGMGLFGAVVSAVRVTPRELAIGMWGRFATTAAKNEGLRNLDWAIALADPCELVFGNASGIRCIARYRRRPTETYERGAWAEGHTGRTRQFVLEWLMESPYFEDASIQTVALSTSGSGAEIPMGNAPVAPIIELTGPATAPVAWGITVRDSTGATVETMGFSSAIDTAEKRIIDMGLQTVVDENGVNRISEWNSGDFFTLLPRYFDPRTSDWPTVDLATGTGEYRARRTYTVPG